MNRLFLWLLLLVAVPSVAAAGENFDNFCDPSTESTNTSEYIVFENFEGSGTPSGWSCGGGSGCDFDDTSPVYDGSESYSGTSGYAIHPTYSKSGNVTYEAFVYAPVTNDIYTVFYPYDDVHLGMRNDGYFRIYRDSSNDIVAPYNATTWYKAVMVVDWDNNDVVAYVYNTDGDLIDGGDVYSITANGLLYDAVGVFSSKGNMDNLRIYEGTTCPTNSAPTPDNYASERYEQLAEIEQELDVTVSSTAYTTVTSDTLSLSDDSLIYLLGTVNLEPSKDNTAYCRVSLDGSEFNSSESTRSVSAGSKGNLIFTSGVENLTAGNYTVALECRKESGNPTFTIDVFNSSVYFHILTSSDGTSLKYANIPIENGVVSSTAPSLLGSTNLLLSDNESSDGNIRALVVEYAARIDYPSSLDSTALLELNISVDGGTCSRIDRSKGGGTSGTIGGGCYVDLGNNTNSTNVNISVYGSLFSAYAEPINVSNAYFHVKEFIITSDEIAQDGRNIGLASFNESDALFSVDINASRHASSTIYSIANIGAYADLILGADTGSFYLTNGSINSSTITRDFDPSVAGVVMVQEEFFGSGVETIDFVGGCTLECLFNTGNLLAYLTDVIVTTPNEFEITANSIYGGSLSEFGVNLSDGRSFSTTTGTIIVPATDGILYNISAVENGGVSIPYYANYTLGFNSSGDLVLNLTPYTKINATYGGVAVNNFTVDGATTTNGYVYVRLFSETKTVNLTNAVSSGGVNLSDQSANISGSPYLEYYTFALLTSNIFNFSLYDELTEALITENMTIELIDGASAGKYYTTNGTLYFELLTPSDYIIRYYSTQGSNYTQRDYIQTLVDRQSYDIELFGLLNEESTDMTVNIQDTSGDPVEGAIVKLLRYFNSCNCYKVVEMATTSASGESYFVVDAYDGHYKFSVDYNGLTYFLSTSPDNFIPIGGLVTRTITINLGSAYFQSFRELGDIARTLSYNNVTKGLSFTWNDPSGLVNQGCLYAEYLDGVHYTAVTPVCSSGSTGSVVLTLNDTLKTYKYYAELKTSTTYSDYIVFSGFIDKIRSDLLNGQIGLGAFLGAGLIMVLALMFSYSAIAVMIVTVVGVIGMSVLGIASLATVFITGLSTLILGIAAYLMRS